MCVFVLAHRNVRVSVSSQKSVCLCYLTEKHTANPNTCIHLLLETLSAPCENWGVQPDCKAPHLRICSELNPPPNTKF